MAVDRAQHAWALAANLSESAWPPCCCLQRPDGEGVRCHEPPRVTIAEMPDAVEQRSGYARHPIRRMHDELRDPVDATNVGDVDLGRDAVANEFFLIERARKPCRLVAQKCANLSLRHSDRFAGIRSGRTPLTVMLRKELRAGSHELLVEHRFLSRKPVPTQTPHRPLGGRLPQGSSGAHVEQKLPTLASGEALTLSPG